MKNEINIKSIIIVICCITIIFLATGFAYLSIKLNGYKNKKEYFDISIENVEQGTMVKGGNVNPSSSFELKNKNKTISFKFKLYEPGDQITYKVTIANNGTISGDIITLLNSGAYLKNNEPLNLVKIKTSNIKNKNLKPGEKIQFIINVYYNNDNQNKEIQNKTFEIPYELTLLTSCD